MIAQPLMDTRLHPLEAMRAVRRLLSDPGDTRQVFAIFRAMRGRSGLWAYRRFSASPTGAAVLRENRCLLDTLQNRDALAGLASGTFGRTYLAFMEEQNLSAAGLVEASQSWELDPVPPGVNLYRERMREAHDLTHILTGYGRDPLGELCLLAFNYAHARNLGMALIVAMAWPRLPRTARGAVVEAWRNGRKARWFPELDYEALLPRPLEAVRREIGIIDPARYLAIKDLQPALSNNPLTQPT